MDGRWIIVFLLSVAIVRNASTLEARKVLHIPEKIIGGVIDIVASHKNKPSQTAQQGLNQQTQQGYVQYAPWTQSSGSQGYPNQAQYHGLGQYANYGNYPQTGTNYPQSGTNYLQAGTNYQQANYQANSGSLYPSGPVQNGYGTSQTQNQGQYQSYPQNQASGPNQFQSQNQQGNQFQNQNQFQGQGQNTQFVGQGQNNQYQGNQQNQFQGQNQQNNQYVGQNQQSGQFVSQTGNYQGNGQSGQYVSNQQSNNIQGQNGSSTLGQNQITPSSQYGGFQGGQQSGGQGPTCVCQAWTKPIGENEKSSEKTES